LLAAAARVRHDARVALFWFFGHAPLVLVLTLVLALYLTVVELRELRPHYLWWMWWLTLVFLTHIFGYLVLRGYTAYRRIKSSRA
jgi:hypothetical protein